MNANSDSFAAYLAARLDNTRTNNATLAKALGISPTAVWNYLKGNMLPKALLADRIAAYFGDDANMVRRLTKHPESAMGSAPNRAELDAYASAWAEAISTLQSVRDRKLAQSIALGVVRTLASE